MFLRIFVSLALVAVMATSAQGQVQARAYAPEDLRQLATTDRIRVVEKEYRDQSGGRKIPDDQLEFYLDQVDSGWTFSRIKQDIAVSLGGNGWRPPVDGWRAQEVVCTSDGSRYRECSTPFHGRARLTQQISRKACREGSTWGQRQGLVWVNKGCRARFGEDSASAGNNGSGRRATCESQDGRYRECPVDFTGRAQIYRQISTADCQPNRDWGQRLGMIWVSNGCRAEFLDGNGEQGDNGNTGWNGGAGSKITCASQDERYRECPTNFTGHARLSKQLSSSACVVNRDWGQRANVVWVNNGCRAEFTDNGVGQWDGNDGSNPGYSVTCASTDGRYTTCAWNRNNGMPQLIEQQSKTACVQGQTWGYDINGGLWVDRGCRGRFGVR